MGLSPANSGGATIAALPMASLPSCNMQVHWQARLVRGLVVAGLRGAHSHGSGPLEALGRVQPPPQASSGGHNSPKAHARARSSRLFEPSRPARHHHDIRVPVKVALLMLVFNFVIFRAQA